MQCKLPTRLNDYVMDNNKDQSDEYSVKKKEEDQSDEYIINFTFFFLKNIINFT